MGMLAADRISADGTMGKVAATISYALDGKCIRTAKIENYRDIEPMSAGWTRIAPWAVRPFRMVHSYVDQHDAA